MNDLFNELNSYESYVIKRSKTFGFNLKLLPDDYIEYIEDKELDKYSVTLHCSQIFQSIIETDPTARVNFSHTKENRNYYILRGFPEDIDELKETEFMCTYYIKENIAKTKSGAFLVAIRKPHF